MNMKEWITGEANPKTAWLFNPFAYMAGWKALVFGLIAVLAAGYIGSFSNTHFDGVIDVHTGGRAPLWFYLSAGVVDWLCMGLVIWAMAKLFIKKPFRTIDVFGTQALARWPTLLTALVALLPGFTRFTKLLIQFSRTQQFTETINPMDTAAFAFAISVLLLVLIWMIRLMYSAYKISCNPASNKAVKLFIISIIVAEIISKVIIFRVIKLI
jgi:hypothetical protein